MRGSNHVCINGILLQAKAAHGSLRRSTAATPICDWRMLRLDLAQIPLG
jgi:hypothetical protein